MASSGLGVPSKSSATVRRSCGSSWSSCAMSTRSAAWPPRLNRPCNATVRTLGDGSAARALSTSVLPIFAAACAAYIRTNGLVLRAAPSTNGAATSGDKVARDTSAWAPRCQSSVPMVSRPAAKPLRSSSCPDRFSHGCWRRSRAASATGKSPSRAELRSRGHSWASGARTAYAFRASTRTRGDGSVRTSIKSSGSPSAEASRPMIITARRRTSESGSRMAPWRTSEPASPIADRAIIATRRTRTGSPSRSGSDTLPSPAPGASAPRPRAANSRNRSTAASDILPRPVSRAIDSKPMTAPRSVTSGASPAPSRVSLSSVSSARRKRPASAYRSRPRVRPITARTAGPSPLSLTR